MAQFCHPRKEIAGALQSLELPEPHSESLSQKNKTRGLKGEHNS